jgi:hypothetical protein
MGNPAPEISEGEQHPIPFGAAFGQMQGHAIGGHHIKSGGRHKDNACPVGFLVHAMQSLQNGQFPCDVQIMNPLAQTGLCHRTVGMHEGTGTMQNYFHSL